VEQPVINQVASSLQSKQGCGVGITIVSLYSFENSESRKVDLSHMITSLSELERRTALLDAEAKALALFQAIEANRLVVPGRTERDVEQDIYRLAKERFGVEKHWHKRIVRSGSNTLTTAVDNPPVRTIEPGDTVYVDLGPVFEEWEADIGRTYLMGDDMEKSRLIADLERVFKQGQAHFKSSPDMTGAALYAYIQGLAEEAGWRFGGTIAGHVVGEFPHATLPGDKELNRISPRNPLR
jgi:Xaa-Pro aminopeptidase